MGVGAHYAVCAYIFYMIVWLYTFSKEKNSTVRPPAGTTSASYSCVLKDKSGTMAPVIKLDIGLTNSPSSYNYAYIPDFKKYYFISEWSFEDRLWVAYLEEDTLATWRDYIGSQMFYVLRAANGNDGNITDDFYPTYPNPIVHISQGNSRPWLPDLNAGNYVVGIINNSGNAMGAVGYYVFSNIEFRTFCSRLMSNTNWLDVPKEISNGGIDDGLLKTLFNPFQYVVSCKWFPCEIDVGAQLSNLPYGWWTLENVSCHVLANQLYVKSILFTLDKHPQAASRGNYLNCEPFTKITLSMEPFGEIAIDSSLVRDETKLLTLTSVDPISGVATLEICTNSNADNYPQNILYRQHANFGVDIQIAQIAVDRLAQAETVVSGAADIARDTFHTAATATNVSNLLNPIAGGLNTAASGAQTISTAAHAIADGIRSSIPQVQKSGANGSIAAYANIPILIQKFYRLISENNKDNGRPYCIQTTPATLHGYMVIQNADVKLPATINEISAVKAYMESGFYYE